MNVRTVTVGLPLAELNALPQIEPRLSAFFDAITTELSSHDSAPRTCRVTLSPIREDEAGRINQAQTMGQVKSVADACERLGIRWFNVPFDLTRAQHGTTLDTITEAAFEVLRRFPRAFVHLICTQDGRIAYEGMTRASRFIKAVAGLETSGYHNFRVGVGCNVRPNTPFFPFAYSSDVLGFSLGLEMPQVLLQIASAMSGASLPEIREAFLETLRPQVKRIEETATRVATAHGVTFHGIDVSIAPYPEPGGSVAQLMEILGLEQYGGHGTLFLTAYLTDTLKELVRRAALRTVGFNGVMLSLLEDEYMGRRNNYATYSIDSLLLYSTMCGCGIDMVPIPGDTFEEELSSMILDVATVSTLLGKPLGVRVLPVPMKQENEFTDFHMDFLFNTRIKKIRNIGFARNSLRSAPFEFLRKP